MQANNNVLNSTHFNFPGQQSFYKGKVRDVYAFEDILVMVISDRISAFDHVLPKGIPFKGQVLNKTAEFFMQQTKSQVPNWLLATPHPNVAIGVKCEPYKIEMVVRGYLAGHAWRLYQSGKREICGVVMPDGLKESDKFPEPIITPATKAETGHDEDISREEIIRQNIVSESEYVQLEKYALQLFEAGTKHAQKQNLILVDTKYEFGKTKEGKILLIDEIHTPDSSRYYYLEGYEERQKNNQKQKQLSKEFVREWLMENGFQGLDGQKMPSMPDDFVQKISDRYIELYQQVTGKPFVKETTQQPEQEVYQSILGYLNSNK